MKEATTSLKQSNPRVQFDTVMTLSQANVLSVYEISTQYVVQNIFQLSKKTLGACMAIT